MNSWKKGLIIQKEIKTAAEVLARDCKGVKNLENAMVNGPYLDNINLDLTPEEEDERFNWVYNQVLKQAKKMLN
jgi:hypothetical protein